MSTASSAELKIGDRVRLTYEGKVAVTLTSHEIYLLVDGARQQYLNTKNATVEILEKPLTVGDEVTEENKHRLPKVFILVDRRGRAWAVVPYSGALKTWGPFKLIYIHENQD